MWTRAELKDRAKGALKLNYWKTVLIALLLATITSTMSGLAGGTSGGAAGAAAGSNYVYSVDSTTPVIVTGDYSEEELYGVLQENGVDPSFLNEFEYLEGDGYIEDMDIPAEELIESTGFSYEYTHEYGMPYEETVIPGVAIALLVFSVLIIVLVMMAIAFTFDAFIINPLATGAYRFSICNLNQKAQVKEAAYAFDNNYREIVKTMFLRDIFTLLWSLLLIIPGIVKSYEYRMIPYLLADDPTMTKDRAFAESRSMMQGNKWKAFVLDLSFIGWHLLSLFTLGLLEIFYVEPYQFMTNAALYESLRYGTPGAQQELGDGFEQVPVPAFAEEGFAPQAPEA